jgi:putative FmdB family regulatory protein
MPVYEYQCQGCGHEFEATQRIAEPKLVDCPQCQTPRLERLISATSFQLKGGGWYRDGYGDKKGKARTDNDRADRLTKALDEDKKKTGATDGADSSATKESSSPSASPSSEGSGSTSTDKSQAA